MPKKLAVITDDELIPFWRNVEATLKARGMTMSEMVKKCGAEIIFIRTIGGNLLPCDPKQVCYWKGMLNKSRVVTPSGEVIACELDGIPSEVAGIGYIPHFSRCRVPKKSGKKKKQPAANETNLFG